MSKALLIAAWSRKSLSKVFINCLEGVARLRKRFINSSGCPWANLARTYGTVQANKLKAI